MKNFYEILNVKTDASSTEIKSAYLKLIKKYHPDTYKGDKVFAKEQTEQITEAYATLKDDEKRKRYDLTVLKKVEKINKVNVDNFMKKVKIINEKNTKNKNTKQKESKSKEKEDKKNKEVEPTNNNQKTTRKFDIAIIVLALILVAFLVLCFV